MSALDFLPPREPLATAFFRVPVVCMESAVAALFDAIAAPENHLSERAEAQFQALQRNYRGLETFWLLNGQKCSNELDTFRSRGLMTCASLREALHAGEAGGKP